jgi:hypothetical protein
MRRLLPLVPGVFFLMALAGCATSMTVSSHVDRTVDFAQYRSYDWGPAGALPTGDPRLDKDPFFQDVLQGAIEKELGARGLTLAEAGTSDLLIHYHASVTRRLDVNTTDTTYGYCSGTDCVGMTTEYEAGTIVVDFVDVRSNKVIWRGWVQDTLEDLIDDRDRMAERINEGVTRMLARLPSGLRR